MPDENKFAALMRSKYPKSVATTVPGDVVLALKAQGLKEQAAKRREEQAQNYRAPATIRMPRQPSSNWVEQQKYLEEKAAEQRGINKPLNQMNAPEILEAMATHPMIEYPMLVEMGGAGIVKALNALRSAKTAEKVAEVTRLMQMNKVREGAAAMPTDERLAEISRSIRQYQKKAGVEPESSRLMQVPPPTRGQLIEGIDADLRAQNPRVTNLLGPEQRIAHEAWNPTTPLYQQSQLWTPEQLRIQREFVGFDPANPNLTTKLQLEAARTYVGRNVNSPTPFSMNELVSTLGPEGSRLMVGTNMPRVPTSFHTEGVLTSSLGNQRAAGFAREVGLLFQMEPEQIERLVNYSRRSGWRGSVGAGFTRPEDPLGEFARIAAQYRRSSTPLNNEELARRFRAINDYLDTRMNLPPFAGRRGAFDPRSYIERGAPLLDTHGATVVLDQHTGRLIAVDPHAAISRVIRPPTDPGSPYGVMYSRTNAGHPSLPRDFIEEVNAEMANTLSNWRNPMTRRTGTPYMFRFDPDASAGHSRMVLRATGEVPANRMVGGAWPSPVTLNDRQTGYIAFGSTPNFRLQAGASLPPSAEATGQIVGLNTSYMMPYIDVGGQRSMFEHMHRLGYPRAQSELFYPTINKVLKRYGGRLSSGGTGMSGTASAQTATIGAWQNLFRQGKAFRFAAPGVNPETATSDVLYGMFGLGAGTGLGLLGYTAANQPPVIEER